MSYFCFILNYWYCYWYWIFNIWCNNCCYSFFGISLVTYYLLICFFGITTLFGIDSVLLLAAIVPIKSYSNAEADKDKIIKENKDKSGIYMFENTINGKRYIGSSENLKRRFSYYFYINYLLKNNSMYICNSLIKYGYCNFSFTILEYCEPDKCLIREKHYLDLFKPEYNIAQDPTAPMSGRIHSDETKQILSDAKKGQTLSDETRKQISDALKGQPKTEGSEKPCQAIEVTDIKNDTTIFYDSISEAAKA